MEEPLVFDGNKIITVEDLRKQVGRTKAEFFYRMERCHREFATDMELLYIKAVKHGLIAPDEPLPEPTVIVPVWEDESD